MSTPLERLLQHPSIWRAGRDVVDAQGSVCAGKAARSTLSTGFGELDARLPGGGWPFPALIESLSERSGLGEIGLLLPALRALQSATSAQPIARAIAWLNPPFIPYPPALAESGLDLQRQLVAGPLTPVQSLWAMEQAMRSGACAAVLAWADRASTQALRRLKLAASEGGCLGVLFRSSSRRVQSSPASIRLALSRCAHGLQIELLKVQRGKPATLSLADDPDARRARAAMAGFTEP